MKKFVAYFISFLFVLSVFSGIAFADEESADEPAVEVEAEAILPEETEVIIPESELVEESTESVVVDSDDIGDNDELLMEYMEYSVSTSNPPMYSIAAYRNLSGIDVKVYGLIKACATAVARGEERSTVFTFSMNDLGLNGTYSASDLGVEAIVSDGAFTTEAKNAMLAKLQAINLNRVNTALLYDCPMEFYWYEKTVGCTMSYSYGFGCEYDDSIGENVIYFSDTSYVSFSYTVAEDYAVDNESGTYVVDSDVIASIQTAIDRTSDIINAYAGQSDYQKLLSYKTEICNAVSYNTSAGNANYTHPYGNPWQLIWVFDEDDTTNVVCEGYSKAFQFLCDGSQFSSDKIESRIVTGNMSGGTGEGGHMWNVVTMDNGQNYLVDVTNCDDGTIGYPDHLFLVGYTSGSVSGSYSVAIPGQSTMTFTYDDGTRALYEEAELTLSASDYEEQEPVTAFSIENLDIVEGTSGFYSDMSPTGEMVWWYDLNNNDNMIYHITYAGTEYIGTKDEILQQLYDVTGEWKYSLFNRIIFSDNQHLETWVAGKTYTAEASLQGMTCTFSVSIKGSPLTEFRIENITIYEGTNGNKDSYWDEDAQAWKEYYYYKPWNSEKLQITLTYNDTTYTGNKDYVNWELWKVAGDDASIDFRSTQGSKPWEAGNTYSVSATCLGIETSFEVTIEPMPLESIYVDDVTIYEGSHCYLDENAAGTDYYLRYDLSDIINIKILFDGEEYSGTPAEIESTMSQVIGTMVTPQINAVQSYDHPWVSGGTYEATVSFLGEESTFEVTIAESPFTSIEAENVTLIENADGYNSSYYDSNGNYVTYFEYSYSPTVTVMTENGEACICEADGYPRSIFYQGIEFPIMTVDRQNTDHWALGEHQATVYCGGLETTVNVSVVETPIASLQVNPIIAYEGVWLSPINVMRMPYTVTFKDGTTQTCERRFIQYDGKSYGLSTDWNTSISEWEAGNTYYFTASLLGFPTEVPVHVYGIESLEVEENNGLTLFIHQTDGQTMQAKVHTFYIEAASSGPHKGGYLFTDKGIFPATIYNYASSDNQNIQIAIGGAISNVLPVSKWVETDKHAGKWFSNYVGQTSFNGVVNEDNIDQLILVAYLYGTRYGNNAGWNANVLNYDAGFVKNEMYQLFAITAEFDMSMSSYYNAEKNEVVMPMRGAIGGDFDCEVISTDTEQGYITRSAYGPDNDTVILFDENYKIRQVGMASDAPSGLTSIQVDPITIYEGTNCNLVWNQERTDAYAEYNLWSIANATVTYNGKEYSGTMHTLEKQLYDASGTQMSLNITTNQSEAAPWMGGKTYQATASIGGLETAFDVTVLESPFASIEVEDMTLIENLDGYTSYTPDADGNPISYFRYSAAPVVTLIAKDGETCVVGKNTALPYQDTYFFTQVLDDQYWNHWGLGTHQALVYCAGLKTTVNVTVAESPVLSIDMAPFRVYEGVVSSFYHFRPFTVTLKDGTTLDEDRGLVKYNGTQYDLTMNPAESSAEWEAGKTYPVTVKALGSSTDVLAEVYAIDSIEIQEDNGLTLLIHQTNGETVTANVKYFENFGGYAPSTVDGQLVTNQGSFQVTIVNYDTCQNVKIIIGGHESNELLYSKWMETNRHAMKIFRMGGTFEGIVTQENINNLIMNALFFSSSSVPYIEPDVYDADVVKAKMQEVFVITEDFDISMSDMYHASDETIRIRQWGVGGKMPEFQIIATDTELGFIRQATSGPENDTYFLFDDDYKVKKMVRGGPHEHIFGEWIVVTEPTCTEEGLKRRTCTICDAAESEPIAALGHKLQKHAAVQEDYDKPGNVEYWSCSTCKKYFSDADGTHEIAEGSWIIPAKERKFGHYTGLVNDEGTLTYLTDGIPDASYTGILKLKDSDDWYYVKNGYVNTAYNSVEQNAYGWWKIENGKVNFKFNGLAANAYGTWYLKDGKVDFDYTGFAAGMAQGESGWWYVEKGQVKFNKTDILSGTANTAANKAGVSGWWYVINSKVYDGDTVAKNANGWWAIRGGKVDFGYTGFAKNAYGWWYAESGQVTFKKDDILSGKANTDPAAEGVDGWWYIVGSKVTDDTTVAKNAYGWWYVKNGKVDFDYTGVQNNSAGWWYIQKGQVKFDYNGFARNDYGWWYCESGQVTFKKNDILSGKANTDPAAEGVDGWWYIVGSKVTDDTTVAKNAYGWWYVKDGKVDFTYTGLADNEYGSWYCENGKVNFDYNGTVGGRLVINGKAQ